ncbi:MAG: dihydrofolate reductase [Bacteroidetes bacterium]|nr:dihydrofolate reductase [Bacteroidota bacterium]
MEISIIVAVSKNQVIGVNNQLPWHLPADLKYFKNLTLHHPILMGRKTFDSIGRALPKRENIVITRNANFSNEGVMVKNSIDDAIEYCKENNYDEVFIIGGDTIYKQCLSIATKIYLTKVDIEIPNGNAFFPKLNDIEWELISSVDGELDEKNVLNHTFEVYQKRSKSE